MRDLIERTDLPARPILGRFRLLSRLPTGLLPLRRSNDFIEHVRSLRCSAVEQFRLGTCSVAAAVLAGTNLPRDALVAFEDGRWQLESESGAGRRDRCRC